MQERELLWLTVTNIALGAAALIPVLAVAVAAILDFRRERHKPLRHGRRAAA